MAPAPTAPNVVVLAGPNGAVKTTAAPALLRGALGVNVFVNADVIAQGLAAFAVDEAALAAGRVMVARLHELGRARESFAFETTLASRSFAPWLRGLVADGYALHLVYLWLPTPELAIARVADRARLGGHLVPPGVVRRRYYAGLRNFGLLYQPIATTWRVYNGAVSPGPRLVAEGQAMSVQVRDPRLWAEIESSLRHA